MTRSNNDWNPQSYFHAAGKGRELPHAKGASSYDNLVTLDHIEQEQVPQPRLRQPAAPVPAPDRGGEALGSPQPSSTSLDQYAPMLPSDPVSRLPLLSCPSASAAARVAAWLLGEGGQAGGSGGAVAAACSGADSGDDCADVARLQLAEELEEEAPGVSERQPRAQQAALLREAADAADGYAGAASFYAAQRRSLDGFMRTPVLHGDALNNYVASLY